MSTLRYVQLRPGASLCVHLVTSVRPTHTICGVRITANAVRSEKRPGGRWFTCKSCDRMRGEGRSR